MTTVNGSDLRIGTPEREQAQEALQEHLEAERLDPAEYERRQLACRGANTRSELMQIFADLPEPHPLLPVPGAPDDDEPPGWFLGAFATLILGLPVAIVLGVVYGAWWTLAVPVAVTMVLAVIDQLRGPR